MLGIAVPLATATTTTTNIFQRKTGNSQTVGQTVSALFADEGISMQRGNNDINAGISKNWQYLTPLPLHENPITGARYAPHFYVSDRCIGSLMRSPSITSSEMEVMRRLTSQWIATTMRWTCGSMQCPIVLGLLATLANLICHLHGWRGTR